MEGFIGIGAGNLCQGVTIITRRNGPSFDVTSLIFQLPIAATIDGTGGVR